MKRKIYFTYVEVFMINLFIPGKSNSFGLVKSSVLKVVKTSNKALTKELSEELR